ncbi:hypothetical protein [Spirosoma spitsbergense]|nr:hypothetical protein [Spirosoma spitsbergense]
MNDIPNTPERRTALTDEDYDRFEEQIPALAHLCRASLTKRKKELIRLDF